MTTQAHLTRLARLAVAKAQLATLLGYTGLIANELPEKMRTRLPQVEGILLEWQEELIRQDMALRMAVIDPAEAGDATQPARLPVVSRLRVEVIDPAEGDDAD